MSLPEITELHRLFVVDDAGRLIRNVTIKGNSRAGQQAGAVNDCGYRRVEIGRVSYAVHRIVFAMTHGRWPDGPLDHINGNRDDNRPCNLRECSLNENGYNRKLNANSSTGHKGVSWARRQRSWRAIITAEKQQKHLGYFKDIQDAVAARKDAEALLHGSFARGGS